MTEIAVFILLVIGGAIVLLWRGRRTGTSWRESPNAGEPFDRTDRISFTNDPEYDAAALAAMRSRPVSREEGHGKDGGGA